MTETTSRTIKEEQGRRIAADLAQVARIAALEEKIMAPIYATTAQLNAEIAARKTADTALSARVAPLEPTPTPAPTVPGAPTIGTAAAGDAQAAVSFTAPASNGGSSITSYTVTSTPGSLTSAGASSPLMVTGLTNGTAYTFKVHAVNSAGNGPDSSASNSVTPTPGPTVPGAPTIGSAVAGNAQAAVSFTAPASNGGSPITLYTVTSTSDSTVPGAPTIVTATAGNAQATVSFTAPASNGGSPITSYTVTST